jgi:hypothetical protein
MKLRTDLGEGICKHCGVDLIFWPPPILMHDPGVNEKTGQTELYRWCRITKGEVT